MTYNIFFLIVKFREKFPATPATRGQVTDVAMQKRNLFSRDVAPMRFWK